MREVPLLMLAFLGQLVSPRLLSAQDRLLPVFRFDRLTSAQGLPADQIRSGVVRDHNGYVWVGTLNGLARWDGYACKTYVNDPADPHSLSSNAVIALMEDSKARLWVGSWVTGLSLYDERNERFVNFIPRSGDSTWMQAMSVYALLEDNRGDLWLGGLGGGGLTRLSLSRFRTGMSADSLEQSAQFTTYLTGTPLNAVYALLQDGVERILVGTDRGLLILSIAADGGWTLSAPSSAPLSSFGRYDVRSLMRDRRGDIWVGTKEAGLFRVESRSGSITNYRHRDGDPSTLSADLIRHVAEGPDGNLWICTLDSVDLFSPANGRRIPYLTDGGTPIGGADVRITVDRTGSVWIPQSAGGVFWLSRRSVRFPLHSLPGSDGTPRSFGTAQRSRDGAIWISSEGLLLNIEPVGMSVLKKIDVLKGEVPREGHPDFWSSMLDSTGILWCGNWGQGLFRVDLSLGTVRNFPLKTWEAAFPIVRDITRGEGGLLWIATYYDGLVEFDPADGSAVRMSDVPSRYTWCTLRDSRGWLWAGEERDGLLLKRGPDASVERFRHDPLDERSLSGNWVRSIFEDRAGRVWLTAGNVLNLWDSSSASFRRFTHPEFSTEVFATILGVDHRGRIWVDAYGRTLGIFDPATEKFRNFDRADGYCGVPYGMTQCSETRVVVGGRAGMNVVDLDTLEVSRPPPPIRITRMSINDERVPPAVLDRSRPALVLSHSRNTFEIEFAALELDVPNLVQYSNRLEGLEERWVLLEGRRYVRYAGLAPGEYTFRVRAESIRDEWPPQELAIRISITPPWWQSRWAYAGYAALFVGALFGAYRVRMRDVRLRQKAEIEHLKAEHLADVDRMKSRFFANISHEFRTPLTLILGPIRKWQEQTPDEAQRKDLAMAERNAHRLMRLINQLLDLSKLDAGAMKLKAAPLNIVPLVKGIANSYESSAGLRNIALTVRADREEIEVYCDRDATEKILANLLSNAFKFTLEGGTVSVSVRAQPSDTDQGDRSDSGHPSKSGPALPHGAVEIVVSDTGIGIPPEEIGRVFDRFYQVDASQTREHEGSGIGLALVKELVSLHRGAISVKSEVGKGTTFTVQLPLGRDHLREVEIAGAGEGKDAAFKTEVHPLGLAPAEPRSVQAEHQGQDTPIPPLDGNRPTVLIVEDNADVRGYIRGYLGPEYDVLEACDGAEGIERAIETVPDLVISDVMMPKKDGYEVCRALKLDERTNHIPLILLTAKAGVENKIEGLEIGADDYVVKPFEPKELLARARNLITLRRSLREKFTTAVPLRPGEIAVPSMGESFLQNVRVAVERHIGEEGFSVEDLSRDVGLSRSQVLRKLTELTGMSAREFVRYIRLHRAMDLLKQDAGTVSEIAYSVGFSSPAHFTKCFHDLFGTVPSEVKKGKS